MLMMNLLPLSVGYITVFFALSTCLYYAFDSDGLSAQVADIERHYEAVQTTARQSHTTFRHSILGCRCRPNI